MSFASKMILSYLTAIILTAGGIDYFLTSKLRQEGMTELRERLQQSAELIEPYFSETGITASNQKYLENKLKEFSNTASLRLALYDRQGGRIAAVGISEDPPKNLQSTLMLLDLQQAAERGQGFELRKASSGDSILYFAKKTGEGFLEMGLPTSRVDRLISVSRMILWIGTVVWIGLSLALSRIYFKRLQNVLTRWRRLVKKFEKNEVSGFYAFRSEDELEKMGQWINQMSTGLEKKIAELTRERNQLRTILDTMQEGVLVLDSDGDIQITNPAAEELLGIQDSALGRPPIEAVRNPDLQEMVDETLAGQGPQKREIRILRDGQEAFLLMQATSFPGPGPSGAILAFFDITPMRKLERVRRDFVANVSHEIKTPLTSIQGYVETLLDGAMKDPEAAKNFLSVIDANSKRLSKLVEDLLRLSEIESQRFVLNAEEIEVKELFEEVTALQDGQLKKKEAQVRLSIELSSLKSDRNALLHILGNLLENAVKYGRPGQVIHLECRGQDGAALFSVSDQGIGIEKSHIDRIFERFYRIDPSRSRSEGGTGLGLSIVKHLVQHLGGEVWAESEYGSGSTFYFTIPLTHPSSAIAEA